MSASLFQIGTGLDIDGIAQVLYGSINPDTVVTAGKGSIYMKTDDGTLWHNDSAAAIGTDWTQFVDAAGASIEDSYQNTFMGKSGVGSETPTYSSTNVVTDTTSLETAIGALDAEIGNAITGALTRGYSQILDQAINDNILILDTGIGSDAQHTSTVFTATNQSIKQSISALDAAIAASEPFKISGTAVNPTSVVVDFVLTSNARTIEWLLTAQSTTNATYRKTWKIIATNDGVAPTCVVDYTKYAIIKTGSPISGLSVDVVPGVNQMELQITATEEISWKASRITLAA